MFLLVILSTGCKDPDNVGLEVLPPEDLAGISVADTFSLTTEITKEDSLQTRSDFNAYVLGAMNDNVFGKSNASFYTQLNLITANPNFSNATCDSVVVSLLINGYYGDTLNSIQQFSVYRLNEPLYKDSTRYTNQKPQLVGTPIPVISASEICPTDSITIHGVTAPQLVLRLDPQLGTTILNASANDLSSASNFNAFFKGLYFEAQLTSGNGAMVYCNFSEGGTTQATYPSKLRIYYTIGTTSTHFDFVLNGSAHFNYFVHDYSTAVFANHFNDPSFGSSLCYVQSMAGIKTKINFPFLDAINSAGNISINKAQLIIYVDNSTTSSYAAHDKVGLAGIDSAGGGFFLTDNIESTSSFGGDLTSGNEYVFNIPRHFQQLLNGQRKNYGLFLVSSGGAVNANRTVIGGGANPSLKMKLKLTYTKLN